MGWGIDEHNLIVNSGKLAIFISLHMLPESDRRIESSFFVRILLIVQELSSLVSTFVKKKVDDLNYVVVP